MGKMKYILVTGAYGGIGSAVAKMLSERGFCVFALDKRAGAAEKNIIPIAADITSEESISAAAEDSTSSGSTAGPAEKLYTRAMLNLLGWTNGCSAPANRRLAPNAERKRVPHRSSMGLSHVEPTGDTGFKGKRRRRSAGGGARRSWMEKRWELYSCQVSCKVLRHTAASNNRTEAWSEHERAGHRKQRRASRRRRASV